MLLDRTRPLQASPTAKKLFTDDGAQEKEATDRYFMLNCHIYRYILYVIYKLNVYSSILVVAACQIPLDHMLIWLKYFGH